MGIATPQGRTKFQDHGYHIGQKRAMQLDFHNYQGSRKKVDMCKVILVRCPRIVSSTFEVQAEMRIGDQLIYTCWRFLCPIRIDILQAHRITAVALHLRVFQGIIFFLREALW